MIPIAIVALLGAVTGALLAAIYIRAFGVIGYGRLIYLVPVVVLFFGSLELGILLMADTPERQQVIAQWVWLGTLVGTAGFSWRLHHARQSHE